MASYTSENLIDNLQNSTLLTHSFVREDAISQDEYLGSCLLLILFSFWACLANVSQVINIVLTPSLRSQPKNLLLVNVCLCELIMGAFLCPMYADTLMKGTWREAATTCEVYEFTFYYEVCVSTVAVMIASVERFYYLLTPDMMDGAGKRGITSLLISLPWFLGAAAVLPMYAYATSVVHNVNSTMVMWKPHFEVAVVFASFLCPAFLVLSMVAGVAGLFVVSSQKAKNLNFGPDLERHMRNESLQLVVLLSLVCVALQLPFFVALLSTMLCQDGDPDTRNSPGGAVNMAQYSSDQCGYSQSTWLAVTATLMLKPGVTPLVMFIYRDVRDGFRLGLDLGYCGGGDGGGGGRGLRYWRRRFVNRRRPEELDQVEDLSDMGQSQQAILATTPM